ncbi:MAG TPA: Wzz/FepE/Etk N-terminal domain-containing protein [Acidobacteriaceae bacterium]|nr:Wzz/FepE/Etk N-terminal domain-containing protein [Acidobacteriaceae bacterium]
MATLSQEDIRVDDALAARRDSVDVLDLLLVLAHRRRLIFLVTAAGLLAGVMLSLLLKPNFTATAVILPPQQESSTASLLNQLGPLASLGGASALGLKNPADMYVGILGSRTIADNLIGQFKLQHVYKLKNMQETRKVLKSNTDIEAGKDGLIQISVTDHDPNRASELANAYVDQLYSMNSNLAITEAAQRRVFFDQQLNGEKKELENAEDDLRATEQKTGLIQLTSQAQMIINSIAQLRAEIASREVELQSLRTSSTEQNPDVIRVNEEIATMRAQLAKLEDNQHRQVQPGDIAIPAGNVPQESLEYLRKYREVRYHETLFDLLTKQYEAARIDEAKSAPIIQVVDHAIPPDKRSGPKRLLILVGTTFAAFIFSSIWVLVMHGFRVMGRHPQYSSRMHDLSRTLGRSS